MKSSSRSTPAALPLRPRRTPSSGPRGAAALALIGIALLSGCGRKSAPAASLLTPPPPREGYVYIAQLVSEHPLYEQTRRLDQEIAALRQVPTLPTVPPVVLELGELFIPAAPSPPFPTDTFGADREQWQVTLLPDRRAELPVLAPDLAAELAWQRNATAQWAEREAARAVAREDAWVADKRAAAVRERQEALNNAGLNLTARGREGFAAIRRTREEIWVEIEQETTRARVAAEGRLTEARQRIANEVRQRGDTARADIWQRMEKRTETALNSGSETRLRMSKALVAPEPLALESSVTWRPEGLPAAAQLQPTLTPFVQADARTRATQAAVLAAARARLQAELYRSVALAVLRVAGTSYWLIHLPPDEPARGSDLTELVRPEVRALFHPRAPH